MKRSARSTEGKKVIYISLAANIFLAIMKLALGLIAASAALIADGFHSFSDVITTLGVMLAMYVSRQPPDENHHYGHRQAEPLAATGLGAILLLTAVFLGRDMILRLIDRQMTFPGSIALVGIFLSIGIKELLYRYVSHVGKKTDNSALQADAWHHRGDVFSSLAAGVGIIGARLGYPLLDPLAGVVVAVLILHVAYKVIKQAFVRLLGRAPDAEKMRQIKSVIAQVDKVEEVLEVKGLYHGPELYLDVKITVPGNMSVEAGHDVAVQVRKTVQDICEEAEEVIVHVDPAQEKSH